MSRKKGRDTVKGYFHDGAMPSSGDFSDLIDSCLNMVDDGFDKSDENGLEVSNIGEHLCLASFSHSRTPEKPQWHIRFDGDNATQKNLVFGQDGALDNRQNIESIDENLRYALNLTKSDNQTRVGMGIAEPQEALHVFGCVQADGRRGKKGAIRIVDKASRPILDDSSSTQTCEDGAWAVIAGPFEGPIVLEVVARISNGKSGQRKRQSMLHAIALNVGGRPKRDLWHFLGLRNEIRSSHAFLESYFLHRLKLKWHYRPDGHYELHLKARCRYGEGSEISYHVSNMYSEESL